MGTLDLKEGGINDWSKAVILFPPGHLLVKADPVVTKEI